MPFSDRTVLWFAAACYTLGLVHGTVALLRERRHSRFFMYGILCLGFALQSVGLGLRGQAVGGCPIGNTFEILQFCAWSALAIYLLVGATFRLSMLGYFAACLAAALTSSSLVFSAWDAQRSAALAQMNPWVAAHAGLAFLAYGAFGMLALTAALYLFRDYSLRRKRLGGWFSFLPSLTALDHISLRLLVLAQSLLTLALGVGYMYWRLDEASLTAWKLGAVLVLWLAYGSLLGLRLWGRWVGARFASLAVLLYLAALLSIWPIDRSRGVMPGLKTKVPSALHP